MGVVDATVGGDKDIGDSEDLVCGGGLERVGFSGFESVVSALG